MMNNFLLIAEARKHTKQFLLIFTQIISPIVMRVLQ